MNRIVLVVFLLTAAPILSGCLGSDGFSEPFKPGRSGPSLYTGSWPEISEAAIRPGVQVITPRGEGAGQCTANFMFRSADNASLYLGLAAHCFGVPGEGEVAPLGTAVQYVRSDGQRARLGVIAYNAWESGLNFDRDFGLVKLDNTVAVRGNAHPAVLHFGGPTGIAASDGASPGMKVITYGHSSQRSQNDPDNPREGWVLAKDGEIISVVTDHPGIQGDSGSGLMTGDGRALGVLSTGTINPTNGAVANRDFPSINNYVALDTMLNLVRSSGEGDLASLELVTWELVRGPELPV